MKKQKEIDPALLDPDKYRGENLFIGGGRFPKGEPPEWVRREPVSLKTILNRRKTKKTKTFGMKNVLIFLALVFFSCATVPKQEYDYYYFSYFRFNDIRDKIAAGTKPPPNFSQVDGVYYTLCCIKSPCEDVEHYKKAFPDLVLVKKLPHGTGVVTIHY